MSDSISTNSDNFDALSKICTICARGGSKGVPNKNLRVVGGKPLIAHSILVAKSSGLFDAVAVSSDSDEILSVSREWGADHLVKRPDELATDEAPKVPVMHHCVLEVERRTNLVFDIIMDLSATSPLRDEGDLRGAIELLLSRPCSNVLTGTVARRSPYYDLLEVDERGYIVFSKPLPGAVFRRQDSPPCFDANGSHYAWRRDAFFASGAVIREATLMYIMPEERSYDIDSELDVEIVDFLMQRRQRQATG